MSDTLIDLISVSSGGKATVRLVDFAVRTRSRRNDSNTIKPISKQLNGSSRRLSVVCLVTAGSHNKSYQLSGGYSGRIVRMANVETCKNLSRSKSNREGLTEVSREQVGDSSCLTLAVMRGANSLRYKSILASRSVPILFILFCFLIIANTRCDHVGSTNVGGEMSSSSIESSNNKISGGNDKDLEVEAPEKQAPGSGKSYQQQRESVKSRIKPIDPRSILREIYLDHGSKIITMLSPQTDPVQKFHPNGRYGRRSMDNYAEPHAELGHLVYDNQLDNTRSLAGDDYKLRSGESSTLRKILHNISRGGGTTLGGHQSGAVSQAQEALQLSKLYTSRPSGRPKAAHSVAGRINQNTGPKLGDAFTSNGARVANLQLEMNKLLKCNYSGVSGLYWCDSSGSEATSHTASAMS